MEIDPIITKINNKDAVIGIIGLGYVGLPLALCFAERDSRQSTSRSDDRTIGFDIDESKVYVLHAGKSYIKHISEERIERANKTGLLNSTSDFSQFGNFLLRRYWKLEVRHLLDHLTQIETLDEFTKVIAKYLDLSH